MTPRRSKSETEVPLYLIPSVIARQIREQRGEVYRISVKRTHWHHYNITVRTKSVPRELRVRETESLSPAYGHPDGQSRDERSGGIV